MAAVIGDYVSDHTHFHNIISPSGLPHEHSLGREPYRSESRNRPREIIPQKARSPTSPSHYRQPVPSATPSKRPWESTVACSEQKAVSPSTGASRLPSPPDSSTASSTSARAHDAKSPLTSHMATETQTTTAVAAAAAASVPTPTPTQHQPSPESEALKSSIPESVSYSPTSPQCHTIVVRDLAHIQSLARADLMNLGNGPGILNETPVQAMKYEISGMPIGDIIEMVAALLTKITTTNDLQHDALHRNAAHQHAAASHSNDGTSMSPLSSSVLAFHGKNVPAITILSYLSRIHKYCPTTYEVFLSLLVYFDRMTERINNLVMEAEARRQAQIQSVQNTRTGPSADTEMPDQLVEDTDGADSDLVDDDDDDEKGAGSKSSANEPATPPQLPASPATYFVADSFNIHRLIIAGVTCASKFFSDVFYTNSRYAKVC